MIKTIKFNTEQEWKEFRKKYIMASEISSILGLNKNKTANAYLQEKFINPVESSISSVNSRRGKILESAVISALEHDLGWVIHPNGRKIYYDDQLGIGATPDAFQMLMCFSSMCVDHIKPILEKAAIIECKSSSTRLFELYWRQNRPFITQIAQTYVQMMLTGMQLGFLAGITVGEYEQEGAFNPVVDVKLAYYSMSRRDIIDNMITELVLKFQAHRESEPKKRYMVSAVVASKLKNALLGIVSFHGVIEGVEKVEEKEKPDIW